MSASLARRLTLAAIALAGVVFGHTVTYALAIAEPGHRSEHLAGAGHGYWDAAIWAAAAAALLAAATAVARGIRRGDDAGPVRSVARTGAALAVLQSLGFLVLESGERVLTGAGMGDLLTHGLVEVGVLLQIVFAFSAAAALRWLTRTAARVGRARALPAPATRPPAFPTDLAPQGSILLGGAWSPRAPPILRA